MGKLGIIVCPGPCDDSKIEDLANGVDVPTLVATVNRGFLRFPTCNIWAFSDISLLQMTVSESSNYKLVDFVKDETVDLGSLELFTQEGTWEYCRKHFPWMNACKKVFNRSLKQDPRTKGILKDWRIFTATQVAVYMALEKRCSKIQVYGNCLFGENDWDGFTSKSNRRKDSRWKNERDVWESIKAWAKTQKIEITI